MTTCVAADHQATEVTVPATTPVAPITEVVPSPPAQSEASSLSAARPSDPVRVESILDVDGSVPAESASTAKLPIVSGHRNDAVAEHSATTMYWYV